jgi:hypothetical protein
MISARSKKLFLAVAAIGVLSAALAPSASLAEGRSASSVAEEYAAYAFDLLFLRTTGVVKTAIGALILIPAYPISLASGESDEVLDRCIHDPVKETFTRRLGDF